MLTRFQSTRMSLFERVQCCTRRWIRAILYSRSHGHSATCASSTGAQQSTHGSRPATLCGCPRACRSRAWTEQVDEEEAVDAERQREERVLAHA